MSQTFIKTQPQQNFLSTTVCTGNVLGPEDRIDPISAKFGSPKACLRESIKIYRLLKERKMRCETHCWSSDSLLLEMWRLIFGKVMARC